MLLFSDARREIKGVHVAASAAIAEGQRPELVDLDAVTGLVLERAEECAGGRVVGMDAGIAFAEIADEQRAAEDTETGWSERATPGRIEGAVVDPESQIADAIRVETPNEAVPNAFFIFARHGINLGVHDVKAAANRLNIEGVIGVSHRRWNRRIGEREVGRGLERKI